MTQLVDAIHVYLLFVGEVDAGTCTNLEMNIDAVDEIKFVNVTTIQPEPIFVHQLGIAVIEVATKTGELSLNHFLDPCVLHDIDQTLIRAALFHDVLNCPLRGIECVANFVTEKQVGGTVGDILENRHNQRAAFRIESGGVDVIPILNIEILCRHQFGQQGLGISRLGTFFSHFSSIVMTCLTPNLYTKYNAFLGVCQANSLTSMKTMGYETSISPILGLDTPSKSLQDNNLQKDPRGCNSNVNNNLGQF